MRASLAKTVPHPSRLGLPDEFARLALSIIDNGMLTLTKCSKCGGHFVTHPHEIAKHFVCGLCNPPARAGKGKAAGSLCLH